MQSVCYFLLFTFNLLHRIWLLYFFNCFTVKTF